MSIDQAFSVKNLNKLLQEDREKGGQLEQSYIPRAYALRMQIYDLKKSRSLIRHRRRKGLVTTHFYELRSDRLDRVIKGRKEQLALCVDAELRAVACRIRSRGFRVQLSVLPSLIRGKAVYSVGDDLAQILAIRFVQQVLKAVYDISMPPRDVLVSQVKSLAMDLSPKFILRADVDSFYESVRHDDLLEIIHQSPELTFVVKRIITRLLSDYLRVSGAEKGLPRGVGVSAYLSEIYLGNIDSQVRRSGEVFYYARYVDDMLVMFAPEAGSSTDSYLPSFSELLAKKGLSLNNKTHTLDLLNQQQGRFTYLGYEFNVLLGGGNVRMSDNKEKKYRDRINKAFDDYDRKVLFIPEKASKELFARCLFLTGNMRLFNRKSNAFIGIYYSNKHITDIGQLKGLDRYLAHKIDSISDARLKRRLSRLSFEKGFVEKQFRSFTAKQLSEISRGWRNA